MGIGRIQARAALAAIKAGVAGRQKTRDQVADAASLLQDWLGKFDAQENAAIPQFIVSKQTQFDNFIDALPDVPPDPTP